MTNIDNKVYIQMNKAHDECYTRKCEADAMVKYIVDNNIVDKQAKIWLPFNDKTHNNIFNSLKENGFNNLIATDTDFYETKIDYDIIISNPPFAKRTKLFNKLMELNKSFILLQPCQMFNNNSVIRILCEKGGEFGFLCPRHRMGFITGDGKEYDKTTAFYSFWLCFKTKIKGFKELKENE